MSGRLVVGEVLNETFQFGMQRWSSVFRFAWAPLIIAGLITWGLFQFVFDVEALEAAEKAADFSGFDEILNVSPAVAILAGLAGGVLMMAVLAGAFASIYRLVALGEDRPGFVQLRFDGPAQRVFVAQIILTLINYGTVLLAVLLGLTFAGASIGDFFSSSREFFSLVMQAGQDPNFQPSEEEMQAMAAPIGGVMLGGLIAAPVLIFINIKLAPFVAGSAAENRLLLFGAYRLTSSYFWPLFGVSALFILALFAMAMAFSLAMSFVEVMSTLGGSLGFIGSLFSIIGVALSLAYQVFVVGLQLSFQGIIYRQLKTGQ
ncbi:hypothetical protein PUV54_15845 [Hyphococcus flavus]|uniref:Uncharacterized protein n=1 Tax=Hyphococcus flavus TaxID=1866326 RepID=A0AAF0CFU1_9PROT|nr:hypothetical protein [Hyphococcus flavus]WDI31423.1 hypothetical protein PUV54_15845 [Hyphococcus flavus]